MIAGIYHQFIQAGCRLALLLLVQQVKGNGAHIFRLPVRPEPTLLHCQMAERAFRFFGNFFISERILLFPQDTRNLSQHLAGSGEVGRSHLALGPAHHRSALHIRLAPLAVVYTCLDGIVGVGVRDRRLLCRPIATGFCVHRILAACLPEFLHHLRQLLPGHAGHHGTVLFRYLGQVHGHSCSGRRLSLRLGRIRGHPDSLSLFRFLLRIRGHPDVLGSMLLWHLRHWRLGLRVLRLCPLLPFLPRTALQISEPSAHHIVILLQDSHIPIPLIQHIGHNDTGIPPSHGARQHLREKCGIVVPGRDVGHLPVLVLIQPAFPQPFPNHRIAVLQI